MSRRIDMMPRDWAPRAVLVLPAVLLLVFAAMWLRPSGLRNSDWEPPAPLPPEVEVGVSSILENARSANLSRFGSILERPLFSSTRRPAPVKAAEKADAPLAPPDPLETTRIYGVFSVGGVSGIIADLDGKPRRIPVGGALGPWRVSAVADRDITFTRGGETRVIQLRRARPGLTGAAAFEPSPMKGTGIAAKPAVSPFSTR